MTYHRLAYDDAATTSEMVSDARLAGDTLPVPAQVVAAPAPRRKRPAVAELQAAA